MGPTFHFSEEINGKISGGSFGETDGTEYIVELLHGKGKMVLRVEIADGKPVDLLFTDEQAVAFSEATKTALRSLGLD